MKRSLFLIPVLGLLPLVAGGCRVTAEPVAPMVTVDYTPMRYNGYVVFYDAGEPYYVVSGRRYYITRSNPRYQRYVRHYHTNRDAYGRWERDHRPRPDYDSRRGPRVRDTHRHHQPR
jgi:hypothetical protein